MKLKRLNLEHQFYRDMITNNGYKITREDQYSPVNTDMIVNSSKFMDTEYSCDCGKFIGQDILGQICPCCNSEITLRSLNYTYTAWIDLEDHKVISPAYYFILKRVLGNNMLKFILGDYKSDSTVKYNENDVNYEENAKAKKKGRPVTNDINYLRDKIPKAKHIYEGIGHDEFHKHFVEIINNCAPKSHPELPILLAEKESVFTSKIPLYTTAFRPVSKTSETMYYPKINKLFSMICADCIKLDDAVIDLEIINGLNAIQNHLITACEHLISSELSKKTGFIRSEIVGGPFPFSARSVITLDNSLRDDEVDVPYSTILAVYLFKLTHRLAVRYNMTLEQAMLFINMHQYDSRVVQLVDEIFKYEQVWLLLLREPTLNIASMELCRVRKYKFNDDTISLPTEPLPGYNADFDGDALNAFFIPTEAIHKFESFHHAHMMNYVTSAITLSLMAWNDTCLGLMSE